ncbi:MAG TPA: flagellar hook-length control protein FliK [Clostridia bacterium]|nr:flagellar hook-length control protein FliK [Clostridia bacterium]
MLNIVETMNVFDLKNYSEADNKFSVETKKHTFSDIFGKEKRSLLSGRRSAVKCAEYGNQNKIENFMDKTNNLNNADKPYNRTKSPVTDDKASLGETKKLKKHKDADIDKTVRDAQEETANKDAVLSFQLVLSAILEDILGFEYIGNEDTEISVDKLQNLDSLREQLFSLLETADILSDDFFKQNLETIVDILNKIDDTFTLHNNGQLAVFKPDEMTGNLEEISKSIQSILNESNIIKPINPQNPYAKDDFLNPEGERLTENGEMLANIGRTEKGINNSIKPIDKFILNDKEEQLFKQFMEDNEASFEGQAIVFQQEVNNRDINLGAMKDRVMESKQFVHEIAQKMGTFILMGKNEINIQLIPENLGKLSIKIGLNEGTLTGKIYAENYSVKETIEANLDQLRGSLEEQGLNISSLEVYINSHTQNFENSLYQSAFTNRQKSKAVHIKTDNGIAMLEQNVDETNPYLRTNQFDSLV